MRPERRPIVDPAERRTIVDGLDVIRDSRRCGCGAAVLVCRGVLPCCAGCRCRAHIREGRGTWWRWKRRRATRRP